MELTKEYFDQEHKLTRQYFDQKQIETKREFEGILDKKLKVLSNNIVSKTEFRKTIGSIRAEMATKKDLEGFATKKDLEDFATKKDLEGFATKKDLEGFATKADLEGFATKADLERMIIKQEAFTEEVAATIIEAVSEGFEEINRRLDSITNPVLEFPQKERQVN